MGPFKAIGSFSDWQKWAHSRPLAVCTLEAIGLFKAIGSFSDWQQRAHSRPSAVSLTGKNGPIQDHQQFVQPEAMGPFKAINSFSDWQ
jgi:hypothetical protein